LILIFVSSVNPGGWPALEFAGTTTPWVAPFFALVRYQGKPGRRAQILGQGFTGTSAVTFNGVAATSFNVVSDTYMTAEVPANATTGPLVVTTPSGPLTSNKVFRISK
jgi:hypothetical protein